MGILSFIIGFVIGEIIGGRFLSGVVAKFLSFEVGGVCLLQFPFTNWCLIGLGWVEIITGLVVGIIFYMLFK